LEIFRTQPKRSSGEWISFQSIYSTSDRLNLDAENENLNGNLFYSKSFKYYKVTGGINAGWNKNFV
jgi:hypothetical protein